MNVTIRVTVDTDLASLAKMLTLVELPDRPRLAQVRAAAGAVVARYGLPGALRRYDGQLAAIADPDDARDHETHLAWCTTLARQAFPPPRTPAGTRRPATVRRLDAD